MMWHPCGGIEAQVRTEAEAVFETGGEKTGLSFGLNSPVIETGIQTNFLNC